MANYFSKYQGRGGPAIAPGIVQMMGSIGDEYAKGIEGLAEGIEKHRQNKEKREILTERGEWVANQKMQDLATWIEEDPQRIDTKEHDEKLKDIQKFGEGIADMPLGKLEAAISNYALDREIEDRRQTREMKEAEVAESKRRWDITQQDTKDYRDTQTGFTERAEGRTIEDRKEARGKEDAGRKVHQAFAAIPTQTEYSKAGYFEEREVPVETSPQTTPQGDNPLLDEVLETQGYAAPAAALRASKKEVQKNIDEVERTLASLGASRNEKGEISVNPIGPRKKPVQWTPPISSSYQAFTPNLRAEAEIIDKYNRDLEKNPDMGREKSMKVRLAQREQAEQLYENLDALKGKQTGLNQIKKEDIEQYLSPMVLRPDLEETPKAKTESVWHPPSKGTRPTTQIERHRKMQEILAKHGGALSLDELGKFRKEMGKLDPNQPSPFRYEKGPNDTWLATHQGTGATVNLGQEGHMGQTEIGYIHRRAENQLKRLDKAKEAAEAARTRFENAVAGGISSEAELKALQAQWDRAQAALEQEQPILKYGPDGWEN